MWDTVFMFSTSVLELFLRGTVMYLGVFFADAVPRSA